MSKTRELMNRKEIPEALRLFVVNSLARTTAYDHIFAPMTKGQPAIIRIDLIKRKQIRVTAAPDLSKQLENEQADNKKLTIENRELRKDCDDYEKQIKRLTGDLASAKQEIKELKKKPARAEQSEDSDS